MLPRNKLCWSDINIAVFSKKVMLFTQGEKKVFGGVIEAISMRDFRNIFITGSVETIIWLEENVGILYEEEALLLAEHGRLDVIKILVEKFAWDRGNLTLTAVSHTQLDTASWLLKNTRNWHAGMVASHLYASGIDDRYVWLKENMGIPLPLSMMEFSVIGDNLQLIKDMCEDGYRFTPEMRGLAIKSNAQNILCWMSKNEYL